MVVPIEMLMLTQLIGTELLVNYDQYSLSQNLPNPFGQTTTIRHSLPKDGFVKLTISDMLGYEVETLVNELQTEGTYEVTFSVSSHPAGVYLIHFMTAGH